MTRFEASASAPSFLRPWMIWTAGFLVFPLAGLAGTAVAGRVDDPRAALLGGAVVGLVIGAGQTLASRRRLAARRWVPATVVGAWASDCCSAPPLSATTPRCRTSR